MENYAERLHSNWRTSLLVLLLTNAIESTNSRQKIQPETDDFKTLIINNNVYVDKTQLIEEYVKLSAQDNLTLLIVQRPQGWSKTTNMKMLETFLEIEVDHDGNHLPKEHTINDHLFLGGSINGIELNPLKISNSAIALHHLGQHPVIFLRFKNAIGSTYEEIVSGIESSVMEAYKKHEYLSNSSKITNKIKLKNYLDGYFNETDLITSINFLSEKLYEHFGRKVHILIDDYDIPFVFASMNNYTVHYTEIETLLKNILENSLSKNQFLSTALLNAVYPLNLSLVWDDCTYYTNEFSLLEYYGFTQTEVEKLWQDLEIPINPNEFKNWYGGYYVNGKNDHYNARSVMRCLAQNGAIAYYGPTITVDPCEIKSFDYDYSYQTANYCNRSDNIFTLLIGKILLKNVRGLLHILTTSDLKSSQCSGINISLEDYFVDRSWPDEEYLTEKSMLVYGGFLTTIASIGSSDSSQMNAEDLIVLQELQVQYSEYFIPNNEIAYFYQTIALQWICHMFELQDVEFYSFVQLILAHKMMDFITILSDHVRKSPRVYEYLQSEDTTSQLELYNAFIMSLKLVLSTSHTIKYEDDDTDFNEPMAPCHVSVQGHSMIFIPKSPQSDRIIIKFEIISRRNQETCFSHITTKSKGERYNHRQNRTTSILQKHRNIEKFIEMSLVFCEESIAMEYVVKSPEVDENSYNVESAIFVNDVKITHHY